MYKKQERENYRFSIIPLGGKLAKNDRIRQLIPIYEQGRMYLPESCFRTDYEGKVHDLVDVFLNEEYDAFPVPVHDDMLDCQARILDEDLGAIWPMLYEDTKEDRYSSNKAYRASGSAWSA